MKFRGLAAASVLSVLALASVTAPAQAKLNSCEGPIVFGTTISLTGPFSTLADRWGKMTDVFAEEFNKDGGVFVKSCNKKLPIKIIYYDDQSVPAQAVSLYEKMATVDKVDLFLGPDWSSHGFPVSQIFEKYKTPSVMSNVATPKVYQRGFKYIHGIALHARTWSKNYFDLVVKQNPKPKTVFWVIHDNLVTKTVQKIFKGYSAKVGIKTVGEETFAGTTKDFSGIILKMKAARPDIIYIASFDSVSIALLQQMRQLKVKALDVHHMMATGSLARQANLEGVTGEVYWLEQFKGPYHALATRVLGKAGINTFDYLWTGSRLSAYLVMIQAIERAGVVDRQKIADALNVKGATWKHLGGEFKFDAGGLSDITAFTHQIQHGKPVLIAPPEIATGKIIWPSPSWQ